MTVNSQHLKSANTLLLHNIHFGHKNKMKEFNRDCHIRYFAHCLKQLPSQYSSLDTNRLTLVHFAIQALDILGSLPNQKEKKDIVQWIYKLQTPNGTGFMGGTFSGEELKSEYNQAHIAMTYTALCTLNTLGDDLTRINKGSVVHNLKELQRDEGR